MVTFIYNTAHEILKKKLRIYKCNMETIQQLISIFVSRKIPKRCVINNILQMMILSDFANNSNLGFVNSLSVGGDICNRYVYCEFHKPAISPRFILQKKIQLYYH